jgi:elongation factor 1-delta
MSSAQGLAEDNIWYDKWRFEEAEVAYQEHLAHLRSGGQGEKAKACPASSPIRSSLAGEIAKAREHIQKSLNSSSAGAIPSECFVKRVGSLEVENKELKKIVKDLEVLVSTLTSRVAALEHGSPAPSSSAKPAAVQQAAPVAAANHTKDKDEDEEDFELFGSDEEADAEADRVKEERLKAYEAKKSKKTVLIAKSNIILDVKPWDDETDMSLLEKSVRSIEMDGLLWGASKLVPVGYGIKKLQISCVVEDDKVSTDDLEEKITAFEDYIQSMDIAAFNKV